MNSAASTRSTASGLLASSSTAGLQATAPCRGRGRRDDPATAGPAGVRPHRATHAGASQCACRDPALAFTATLHAFVLQVFYHFASDTCLELSLKSASFRADRRSRRDGVGEGDRRAPPGLGRDLPKDEGELWEFLIGLDEASRQALFAHCVSLSLNAVIEPWNRRAPRPCPCRPPCAHAAFRHGLPRGGYRPWTTTSAA